MGEPVSAVVILIQAISGKGEFILRYPEESGFPWKPESRVAVAQAQAVGPGVSGGRFPSHVQPSSAVLARSPRPRSQVQASAPAAASEGACPQQIGSYVGTEERWGRGGGDCGRSHWGGGHIAFTCPTTRDRARTLLSPSRQVDTPECDEYVPLTSPACPVSSGPSPRILGRMQLLGTQFLGHASPSTWQGFASVPRGALSVLDAPGLCWAWHPWEPNAARCLPLFSGVPLEDSKDRRLEYRGTWVMAESVKNADGGCEVALERGAGPGVCRVDRRLWGPEAGVGIVA